MMILTSDMIEAKVGNVTFRSHGVRNADGSFAGNQYILDPTAMLGWTDGVSVRRESTARLNSHGDFAEKATLSSRVISFSGTAIAETVKDLHAMRDNFMGVLNNGEYSTLSVQNGVGHRFATVGLESTPSWVQQLDTVASWKIDFFAPDPRIYGGQRRVTIGAVTNLGGLQYPLRYPLDYGTAAKNGSESASIKNQGNSEAWPEFYIVGDYFSGFTISNGSNKKVAYSGTVTMQAPVTINMAEGTAIQGGVDKSTLLTVRDWFSIAPQGTIRPKFTPTQSGNGWCDIIWKDTWI